MASSATPKQMIIEQPQSSPKLLCVKSSGGILSFAAGMASPMADDREAEDMTKSALSAFRAKEEEIERRRREVTDRVQAQLGRVEEETKRLAEIREELEGFVDPVGKEVAVVRKRIDLISRDLKPLGQTCQKKEREYREVLEAFNTKTKEKAQLITKLMELVTESEKLRMKKLEELSKNLDSLR
nr:RAB6-interacting golgin like [Ipomoea batatas]